MHRKIIYDDSSLDYLFNRGPYYFHDKQELREFTDVLDDEPEDPDDTEWY
ncbi:MAG: hypothetical protein ACFFAS_07000 [Promethearchaeota archaeon]